MWEVGPSIYMFQSDFCCMLAVPAITGSNQNTSETDPACLLEASVLLFCFCFSFSSKQFNRLWGVGAWNSTWLEEVNKTNSNNKIQKKTNWPGRQYRIISKHNNINMHYITKKQSGTSGAKWVDYLAADLKNVKPYWFKKMLNHTDLKKC